MKNEKDILIQGMSKIIDIPIEVLNIMIEENKCAKEFLKLEKALSLTGDTKNLKTLNKILLFREDYDDLTRLKERDIKFIKEKYDIDIELKESIKKDLDNIEIMEVFEDIREVPKDIRLSSVLRELINNIDK